MSKDHEGDLKQYILTSQSRWSWVYDKGIVDEVIFGFYAPEGGTSGEMVMEWHQFKTGKKPSPRLCCYNDSWHALWQFRDVLAALAELDGEDISP